MPVTIRVSTITITPRPGIRSSMSISGAAPSGSTARPAFRNQPNTPSSKPSAACSTQIVIASGSQTSSPARRYFFKMTRSLNGHYLEPDAGGGAGVAGAGAAAGAASPLLDAG